MNIDVKLVSEVRNLSGAGMMECKKALTEANGDIDVACDLLRKWGQGRAVERSSVDMLAGRILGQRDVLSGSIMVELGCQTDFVANSDKFIDLLYKILKISEDKSINNLEDLNKFYIKEDGKTVEELVAENAGSIFKENIKIKQFAKYKSNGENATGLYVHHNGRFGGMVKVKFKKIEEVKEGSLVEREDKVVIQTLENIGNMFLGINDIAMHIASGLPSPARAIDQTSIPKEFLDKEIEMAKIGLEGKPANIVEKIVAGKLNKIYQEYVLTEQVYVKDNTKKVKDLLYGNEIVEFVRFYVRGDDPTLRKQAAQGKK